MMFSHAELMIDNGLAVSSHQIEHEFNTPSCEVGDNSADTPNSSTYRVDLRCKIDLEMICLHLIKVVMNI